MTNPDTLEAGVKMEASAEAKALCEIHKLLLAARHAGWIDIQYAWPWATTILAAATKLERFERRASPPAPSEAMVAALEWYAEQARLCRLIHSEGDAGRHALADDGGKRARAALSGGAP